MGASMRDIELSIDTIWRKGGKRHMLKSELEHMMAYNESVGKECPLVWKVDRGYKIRAGNPVSWHLSDAGYPTHSICYQGRVVRLYIHRVVCLMNSDYVSLSELPSVDHIDHDKLNNFAGNLRAIGRKLNSRNKKKRGKYRYVTRRYKKKGVMFEASMILDYKRHYVGLHADAKTAAIAADRYLVDLLGVEGVLSECRILNFPEMYGIQDDSQGVPRIIEEWEPPPPAQLEVFP